MSDMSVIRTFLEDKCDVWICMLSSATNINLTTRKYVGGGIGFLGIMIKWSARF